MAKKRMVTFGLMPVYSRIPTIDKHGRSNISWSTDKKGVYKIYENESLIYVGSSTHSLYRTILRHFHNWTDTEQPNRISYYKRLVRKSHNYKVQITLIDDDKKTWATEKMLINKFQPRDNKKKNYSKYNRKYHVTEETFKECKKCYNSSPKGIPKVNSENEWHEKFGFNSNGELLDENGNVLF